MKKTSAAVVVVATALVAKHRMMIRVEDNSRCVLSNWPVDC